MAYLGKARKEDLKVIAIELGETVAEGLKVIDLRNLILKSTNYEEEFVKELLSTVISERIEAEKEERARAEEWARAEEKATAEEKERAEERAFQEKERAEERAFQEKERAEERAFQLEKQRLELQSNENKNPENSVKTSTEFSSKIELQKLIPRFDVKGDDISLFLELFERQAKVLKVPQEKWVTQLIGVLPSEIAHLIAREPEEQAGEYPYVKTMLLKRFKLSPEKFRQNFVKQQKSSDHTWHDFYYEIKNYLEGWLNGLKIETYEQLKDLMIVDQIKKRAPYEFKENFLEYWTSITSPVELVTKIEEFEDVRSCMRGKTSTGYRDRSEKKPWQSKPWKGNNQKGEDKQDVKGRENSYKGKKPDPNFDKRKQFRCFECGDTTHFF